jgi:protein-tyrosine-phosphatase
LDNLWNKKFQKGVAFMKKMILFVCKGNTHRSVVAEICLRQILKEFGFNEEFEVASRGISGCCGTVMSKYVNMTELIENWLITKPILEELGVDLSEVSSHIARSITREDIEKASIVFAMELDVLGGDSKNLINSLIGQFPEHSSKIHFFGELDGNTGDIPDCGKSKDKQLHRLINERIVCGIRNNVQFIINHVKAEGEENEKLKMSIGKLFKGHLPGGE